MSRLSLVDAELPIWQTLSTIQNALRSKGAAVVVAPPGAGKTTALPLALLAEPWLNGQKIYLLQPRRVATIGAATRLAQGLGELVGETVGYRVALESRVGPRTRIEVMTEGVFTRLIQSDPSLTGVGLVIFDEFHERSLGADLGLAFALEGRSALRPDLRLLVMSASLAAEPIARLLGTEIPVIASEGRLFPVTVSYAPPPPDQTWWRNPGAWARFCAAMIRQTFDATAEGDLLVFLPGGREIRRVQEGLGPDPNLLVQTLSGSLSLADQAAVLQADPAGRRRIILATAVAETSLTIPGVRVVIDAGLARYSVFDPRLAMDRLITERLSAAQALQRCGRAGRTGPGRCLRLWDQVEVLSDNQKPEIERNDLSGLVLEAAVWGITSASQLQLASPASPRLWDLARDLLIDLDLLSDDGRALDLGRAAVRLGLHPRWARMLLGLADSPAPIRACGARLSVLLDGLDNRQQPLPTNLADLVPRELLERQATELFRRRCTTLGWDAAELSRTVVDTEAAGGLVARAFPDRVGKKTGTGKRGPIYQLRSGRQAELISPQWAPDWIVAADIDAGEEISVIRSALSLTEDVIAVIEAEAEDRFSVLWDDLVPRVRREQRSGGIVLQSGGGADWSDPAVREAIRQAVNDRLAREGPAMLPWDKATLSLASRMKLIGYSVAEQGDWLDHFWAFTPGKPILDTASLAEALRSRLDHGARQRLEREAPAIWRLPNGRSIPIDYEPQDGVPAIACRLQDMFGLTKHPMVGGQLLRITLLSPANRPIQITQDLPGFWGGSYAEVRKTMRGRYPKHAWPENPGSLPETSGTPRDRAT